MHKYFLLITLLLCGAGNIFAGETFLLKNVSGTFDVKIEIERCGADVCEGKAAVHLFRKNQPHPFQIIRMPEMYFELREGARPGAAAGSVELFGRNTGGVSFEDFNFDGADDLAVRNGSYGSYGAPSHDVFLFSKSAGRFVPNETLTRMASDNLGFFKVDKKRRTLETANKSGCCWHQTVRYSFVNNRPVKTYVFTEDASGGGEKVTVTTEILVKGRWKKTTRTALVKDYYKEQ